MNRKVITLTLVSAFGMQLANASDGTINFNGELTAQTCTVAVNGSVTPAVATVTLPTITTASLTTAGQTAGRTNFNIQLSNCSGTATTAAAFFESGAGVNPVNGDVRNMSGGATNVDFQLVDSQSGNAIKAGDTLQRTGTSRNTLNSTGTTTMPYAVQYLATGTTTPGTVVGSVTYSIDYQ